ncbi:MAG TPA: response regulator [Gemmataceae bacterium]|nr:response regulator [Gemmataceae bacterium]
MHGATILLVDDDEVLSQVLRRVLTRDGYTVVQAASVAEALECARQQTPSLGLIDLRLPDGDGVDLARQLEAQVAHFPLILITAYPLRLRDQPELVKGFAHVLTKPLDLDELRKAIRTSLGAAERMEVLSSPTTGESGGQTTPVSSTPAQPVEAAGKRNLLRWLIVGIGVLVVAALSAALPAVGLPGVQDLLKPSEERFSTPSYDSQTQLVPDSADAIELPSKVVQRLGVTSEPVAAAVAPRSLRLAGSLVFDPNRLGRVQSRFAGEVIAIGTLVQPDAHGPSRERPLEYGDHVSKGQLMAVVLSKDLGEKKSELVDALVQLALDERRLADRKEAYRQAALSADTLNQTRTDVARGRTAVAKAERTLRTWKVGEGEIRDVKEEARLVSEGKKPRDAKKEMEWAKVEVRAPFDGTIVEKNLHLGNLVDPTFDLFKIADLRKLGVVVHAYEEDLHTLEELPRGFSWQVRAGADLDHRLLQNDGLQKIGLVVDPSQHTDPIMGRVDNSSGELRVGQFVTATVNLPAPPKVVSLPSSALEEDGQHSLVFVQPDASQSRYVRRRVAVALRLGDVVYVRRELTDQDRKKGLQEVHPGELIVTEGVLELQSALEDLKAKEKARR